MAHPRACGENWPESEPPSPSLGSSPRVRGKLRSSEDDNVVVGLIPARAGKTPTKWRNNRWASAHPRACGENELALLQQGLCVGSSPRVRGKHLTIIPKRGTPGLIPARAGKTPPWQQCEGRTWAHPRACGENPGNEEHRTRIRGSSPRVRGKLVHTSSCKSNSGLIPARAGKTLETRTELRKPRAHPRACGENRAFSSRLMRETGSSPRVRGKPTNLIRAGDLIGLIPARAGKTRRSNSGLRMHRAHPRACGENSYHPLNISEKVGSSPRVRGKLQVFTTSLPHGGLIPARAGKT